MSANRERFIPSLDGLRAASVALVIAGHLKLSGSAPDYVSASLRYVDAATGVRVFFVISGFLITTLLLAERAKGQASLRRFYLRRFVRLFPVQFAFVVTLGCLTLTTGLRMSECQFVTAITYTKNYACAGWIDGHLWSLAVEEQFYLLWPFLLLRLPRKVAIHAAFVLIAVSPASRAIEYLFGARNTFIWLTSNSDALMIGCLLAMLPAGVTTAIVSRRPALGRSVAVAALVIPTIFAEHLWFAVLTVTITPTLQALAAAYLIASLTSVRSGVAYRALNLRGVQFVGILSYSIYVWQQIFFSRPQVFGLAAATWPLRFPINIALALLTAAASYALIEKTFDRLRRRLRSPSSTSVGSELENLTFQPEAAPIQP